MQAPGYWMHETSGVLRPVVEAYLRGEPLNPEQIAVMRAYLRQWVMSEVWGQNPHMDDAERAWLASLRATVEGLTSRDGIKYWLDRATEGGMDPL
jgi:hypothetical protein